MLVNLELEEEELVGLFGRAACPVFHIACNVLDSALRPIRLAFGLQLLAADQLADGLLHGALGLVEGASQVLASHSLPPNSAIQRV